MVLPASAPIRVPGPRRAGFIDYSGEVVTEGQRLLVQPEQLLSALGLVPADIRAGLKWSGDSLVWYRVRVIEGARLEVGTIWAPLDSICDALDIDRVRCSDTDQIELTLPESEPAERRNRPMQ